MYRKWTLTWNVAYETAAKQMLVNRENPEVRRRLKDLASRLRSGRSLVEAICNYPDSFELLLETNGLEFAALSPVEGRPNRSIMKLFQIRDGPLADREAVFFYKRSQIPFSNDRFSYGVCIVSSKGVPKDDQEKWLEYASKGFDPQCSPRQLKRAFTFTVPG
jgi:hypothetical protein